MIDPPNISARGPCAPAPKTDTGNRNGPQHGNVVCISYLCGGAVRLPKAEVPIQRGVLCDKHQRMCHPLTRCLASTASGRAVHTR